MKIRDTIWHKWFAWHPVYCEWNRGVAPCWAWLRIIWRKQVGQLTPEGPRYCYALPWKEERT